MTGEPAPEPPAPSRGQVPWLLRRLPAIATTAVTMVTGVVLFVVSAKINAQRPWAAGLLVNLGAAVVLFGPLLGLTGVSTRQVARGERRRDARVQQLAVEVGQVQRDVATVLEELSERAVGRLAADRAGEEALIAAVATNPTASAIADALALAAQMHLVSARGPRVPIFDTSLFARWQPSATTPGTVEVTVERQDGRTVHVFTWTPEQPAADLCYQLGRMLQERGQYPGDVAYQPGLMFRDLHHLLDLAYKAATGAGWLVDPIGAIVQLTGDRWAITDGWLTTTDHTHYQITLDRLTEMDWDAHLRGRDIDIGGFREAFDTATAMLASGALTKPRRREF
jgi:hypothetical protein